MNANQEKVRKRAKRARRVRKYLRGDAERPRLTVFRSKQHIYCQIIDDLRGHTLIAADSHTAVAAGEGKGSAVSGAKLVGARVAELALAKGIGRVRFDRGAYKYHGRVKALADAARKAGLSF